MDEMSKTEAVLWAALIALNVVLDVRRGDFLVTWITCAWFVLTCAYAWITRHS